MGRCFSCKGPVEERRVEHVHRWEGKLYILRNLPAEVCSQCGEVFFAPDILGVMDAIVSQKVGHQESLSMPVYSV